MVYGLSSKDLGTVGSKLNHVQSVLIHFLLVVFT